MLTSERSHAILSASSADRWLACPPSARLVENIPDERSGFAEEGTKAHELAERSLLAGRHAHEMSGDYPHDMRDHVQNYLDYVRGIEGELLVEQRLNFSRWVQSGFGTSDAVILRDGECHVIDLKYGKGIRVDAFDNSQLKLYALGAFDAYDIVYGPINTFHVHIVQPRLDHYDVFTISTHSLLQWAETVVMPIAALAWEGKGEMKSGDHCQFCRVRHTCRERSNVALETVGDMSKGAELTNEELAAIYPRLDSIVRWANDLESYCLGRAESGVKFAGLKLVEGRSNRKFIDDEAKIVERFIALGHSNDEIYTKKLIGIGDAEKLIGKKEFAEGFSDVVVKPPGKPALVSITDKRPEMSDHTRAVEELLAS